MNERETNIIEGFIHSRQSKLQAGHRNHYRRTAGDWGYLSAQNWNECQAEQGSEGYKKNKQHDIGLPRLEITETSRRIRQGLGHASGQALNVSAPEFYSVAGYRPPPMLLPTLCEAEFKSQPEEQRRFAILNISGHLFSEASGESARRAPRKAMMLRLSDHKID